MPDGLSHLPIFPLQLVVFPGEIVNLHIFEPRYIQLINECVEEDREFGIPAHVSHQLPGCGTEMTITEIVNRHSDGTMDIRCVGGLIFHMLSIENPAPGKLYPHSEVEYEPEPEFIDLSVSKELMVAIKELYILLDKPLKYDPKSQQPFSFQIGHSVGLSLEEEYLLLLLETETERQDYLIKHLNRVLPIAQNLERTKERIQMNGDFRKFGSPDIDLLK